MSTFERPVNLFLARQTYLRKKTMRKKEKILERMFAFWLGL